MVLITVLIFMAYGIQVVRWEDEKKTKILGKTVYNQKTVYRQVRIFGIIPISSAVEERQESAFLGEAHSTPISSTPIAVMIPGAGLMQSIKALTSSSSDRAIERRIER